MILVSQSKRYRYRKPLLIVALSQSPSIASHRNRSFFVILHSIASLLFYRKSSTLPQISCFPQIPYFTVNPCVTANHCFYHKSPFLLQNTCFTAKPSLYRKTPLYHFIAIAPSHYHLVAYHLSLTDVISLSHRPIIAPLCYHKPISLSLYRSKLSLPPISFFNAIADASYRIIAHRSSLISYHKPLLMRFRNRYSLSHICKRL